MGIVIDSSVFIEHERHGLDIRSFTADPATALVHAEVWAELESRGTPVGAHDLWIAASCIANGHRVTTSNVREFRRVPGLSVEVWSRAARPR